MKRHKSKLVGLLIIIPLLISGCGSGVPKTSSAMPSSAVRAWRVTSVAGGFRMIAGNGEVSLQAVISNNGSPALSLTSTGLGINANISYAELASGEAINIGNGVEIRMPEQGTVTWSNAQGQSGYVSQKSNGIFASAPGLGSNVMISTLNLDPRPQIIACRNLFVAYDLALAAEAAAIAAAIAAPELAPLDIAAVTIATADAEQAAADLRSAGCI